MSNISLYVGSLASIPTRDHSLLTSLTADDHTQYALLAGRSTPQHLAFGTASGASTGYLTSTAHATKGKYFLNAAGTITIDEGNSRVGIGTASPGKQLHTYSGNSGATPHTAADIVVEGADDGWIQFLTPNTNSGGFLFGDPESTEVGIFQYLHATNTFYWNAGGAQVMTIDAIGKLVLSLSTSYIDLSAISAGSPNLKITATSDTPTVAFTGGGNAPTTAPAGYLEILVGANARYIPFWA